MPVDLEAHMPVIRELREMGALRIVLGAVTEVVFAPLESAPPAPAKPDDETAEQYAARYTKEALASSEP